MPSREELVRELTNQWLDKAEEVDREESELALNLAKNVAKGILARLGR